MRKSNVKQRKENVGSEIEFASVIEQSIDGIALCDSEFGINFVNPAFAAMHGYCPKEMIGTDLRNLCAKEHIADYEEVLNKVKSGGHWTGEAYHIHKNEISFPISASISSLRNDSTDLVGFLIICREITEQTIDDNVREERFETFNAMLNSISDYMCLVDKDLNIIWSNKATRNAFGDDILGKKCYEVYHKRKDPCEPFPCFTLETFQDGKQHQHNTHVEDSDGKLKYFHCTANVALRDKNGNPTGVIEIARNVTEQRNTEEALRKAHDWNLALLGSITSVLIGVDDAVVVRRWNAAAAKLLGIIAEEIIGKPFIDSGIKWDFKMIMNGIDECREFNKPIRVDDVPFVKSDGSKGVLGLTITPISGIHGTSSGFVILGADITARRSMELQLRHASKLESIGRLAAGIAHEINTPTQYVGDNIHFLNDGFQTLQQLYGRFSQLLTEVKQFAPVTERIAEIEKAIEEADMEYLIQEVPQAIKQSLEGIERVTKIVRAMKDFSHPGSLEKVMFDLNKAIESTITVARNEWKYVAEMVTDFDATLPPVACFPDDFNQVILNMIINSAQAIATVVGDGSTQKGQITASTRQEGDWAVIRISDTGSGIPQEIIDKVFDPFFTTKPVGKGTGQGLAIAHSVIVKKHDGTIFVESEVGKGTTFTIRLPINPELTQHNDPGTGAPN